MAETVDRAHYLKLSKAELIRAIGVAANTLKGWQDKGCPATRTGGLYYYSLPEVFKWRLGYEKELALTHGRGKEFGQGNTEEALEILELKKLTEVETHRKLKLKNDEVEGLLLDAEIIRRKAYETGKAFREMTMNIPARISAELAVETNATGIENKLRKEIQDGLIQLAEYFENDQESDLSKNLE